MAFYSLVFVQRSYFRYGLLLFWGISLFFIWHPEQTTVVANVLGVGRGLDLIYILLLTAAVIGFLFVIKHLIAQDRALTKLVRHTAILHAQVPSVPKQGG